MYSFLRECSAITSNHFSINDMTKIRRFCLTEFQAQFFICCVVALVVFRVTIAIYAGGLFADLLLSSALLLSAVAFSLNLRQFKFEVAQVILLLYVLWCTFLVLIYGLASNVGNYFVPIVGFFNIVGLLIFCSSIYVCTNNVNKFLNYMKKILVFVGLINATGAIFQYFLSENLFGLTSNSIYADAEILSNENVTKRAISFIASPQSLSLFLAFTMFLVPDVLKGKLARGLAITVFMTAGVLTVSKAFFVFIFVYLMVYNVNLKRIGYLLATMISVYIFIIVMPEDGFLGRVIQILYFAENFEQYSAYNIWKDSIGYIDDFLGFISGKGIGVFSRGGQVLANYELLHGSTESYFIQILVETGIVGFVLLFSLVATSFFKMYPRDKVMACNLVAIAVVGVFTPAPYGYVCGLLLHFSIASGVFCFRGDAAWTRA